MSSSDVGLGISINMLDGRENTIEIYNKCIGKVIEKVRFVDDVLIFNFLDGAEVNLFDGGQDCCERRYMTTDDKLEDFNDSVFNSMEIRDVPDLDCDGDVHEVQFFLVNTSKGTFTMETHNVHNGYYSGFWIVMSEK